MRLLQTSDGFVSLSHPTVKSVPSRLPLDPLIVPATSHMTASISSAHNRLSFALLPYQRATPCRRHYSATTATCSSTGGFTSAHVQITLPTISAVDRPSLHARSPSVNLQQRSQHPCVHPEVVQSVRCTVRPHSVRYFPSFFNLTTARKNSADLSFSCQILILCSWFPQSLGSDTMLNNLNLVLDH